VSELDRIRWHCRRGLLELDLILTRFLDRRLDALTQPEREAFTSLLRRSDNDLWDLVAGRQEEPPGLEGELVRELRQL
jgi:succinate dehydrogenase flavin-adding protein (antitoxin of CptAB toxin-antitoxin module)